MKKVIPKPVTIVITVCLLLAIAIITFSIKTEAPIYDGIWTNEDESFILDTDSFTATITEPKNVDVLKIGYTPGTDFIMYYPHSNQNGLSASDCIHKGTIYRTFNSIHIICDDGCFDVWLTAKDIE